MPYYLQVFLLKCWYINLIKESTEYEFNEKRFPVKATVVVIGSHVIRKHQSIGVNQ